jgi:HipA-like kinase
MHPRRLQVRDIVDVLTSSSTRPLVVATDEGRFVLKLVGGADGPQVLAAEWIGSRLCGAVGLPTLELVALDLDRELAAGIVESELREEIQRGAGLCLGTRELPGARAATLAELERADDDFALRVLWIDILIENPDRRTQNPNVLKWGNSLVPIDHASAFPFHHSWDLDESQPTRDLGAPTDHVYGNRAPRLRSIGGAVSAALGRDSLNAICASVPDEWLGALSFENADRQRAAYAAYLWKRLRALLSVVG